MRAPDAEHDGTGRQLNPVPELNAIEEDLARARARVAASMHALGEEVSRRADWRVWVRERPGWTMAAALALGFLLGRLGDGPGPNQRGRF